MLEIPQVLKQAEKLKYIAAIGISGSFVTSLQYLYFEKYQFFTYSLEIYGLQCCINYIEIEILHRMNSSEI